MQQLGLTDWQDNSIRVGFVARTCWKHGPDGRDHLMARAMNWRGPSSKGAGDVDR